MADIPINPVTRRVEFTGNTGTGPFAFTFNVLAQADVAAYKNNTLLALTSDYTVSLNSNGTGSITLTSALIATDELVIIGDLALSRTTDFVTAGDLLASSLNEQFDSNVVMSQQLDERFDRTIRSQPGDINKNLYLPLVSSRASQLLSFDSSGNITTTSLSNVPDIGTVNLTVSGVASFADGSASAPSITNIGDTNTGMYFGAADQINFSIGGSEVISVASTGTTISGLSISSGDILLTDNSATALEIKEGSNNYLTFITTNGSEKLSFGSTANPTFEVNGSFRQPLIAATTSFFSQTYSGATLSATNGSVNIESYSASKAGIVLNGSGDQITFTSPTLGFVGLVQVVGAITTNTSLNIASSTTVDGILDEDNMASNSATKLATQQSIKAYVDAQVGTVDTLAEVLGNGNTTGGTDIAVSANDDITFTDSSKAIFGAGNDLQIYHDGADSYISEGGTGDLKIQGANVRLENPSGVRYFQGSSGIAYLYNSGDIRLATTSTGIDVTGTVTADSLTVQGVSTVEGKLSGFGPNAVFETTGTAKLRLDDLSSTSQNRTFITNNYSRSVSGFSADNSSFGVVNIGLQDGFISFDTAASGNNYPSEAMRIDSSGNLLVGKTSTSSTTAGAEIFSAGYQFLTNNGVSLYLTRPSTDGEMLRFLKGTATVGSIGSRGGVATNLILRTATGQGAGIGGANSGVLPCDEDGLQDNEINLGASGTRWKDLYLSGQTRSTGHYLTGDAFIWNTEANNIRFATNNTERMRIDSSGRVGIGTSSPSYTLTVQRDVDDYIAKLENDGNSTASNGLWVDTRWNTATNTVFKVTTNSGTSDVIIAKGDGNVGIGTSSPSYALDVQDAAATRHLRVFRNASGTSAIMVQNADTGSGSNDGLQLSVLNGGDAQIANLENTNLRFLTNSSEAMRLDASGNLLVGKTTSDNTNNGHRFLSDGFVSHVRDNDIPMALYRKTSDGEILRFSKDSTTAGSIGAIGGDVYFTSTGANAGLRSYDAANALSPVTNTGGLSDGNVNLGWTDSRFKDLYLSGGVVFGTGGPSPITSNKLDDYEEGTYTATLDFTSGSVGYSHNTLTYTKIGRVVWVHGRILLNSVSSPSGGLGITLPFTVSSSGYSRYSHLTTSWYVLDVPSNTVQANFTVESGTVARLLYLTDGGAWSIVDASGLASNSQFQVSGFYMT